MKKKRINNKQINNKLLEVIQYFRAPIKNIFSLFLSLSAKGSALPLTAPCSGLHITASVYQGRNILSLVKNLWRIHPREYINPNSFVKKFNFL